jgi:hypothetical protein
MRVRVKEHALEITSQEDRIHRLTEGSEYVVIGVYNDELRIISDDGEPIIYPKRLFEVCDPRLPPGWKFEEPEDGDYYLGPCQTELAGFYEDYFCSGGDVAAQSTAQRVLQTVLEAIAAWGGEADKLLISRDLSRMSVARKPRPTGTLSA